jgi:hypothetical protein
MRVANKKDARFCLARQQYKCKEDLIQASVMDIDLFIEKIVKNNCKNKHDKNTQK